MSAQGHLDWEVPEGDWTVLRFGYTTTGVLNHPAPKEGLGLDCDKLSNKAVEAQFRGNDGKTGGRSGQCGREGDDLDPY